jgi:hypothetical protein
VKIVPSLIALALIAVPGSALARGHGGGHHSGSHHGAGSHHGGHHASGSYRGATTFRTGHCKSAKCFRKHPNGTYVHPITPRKRP